MSTQSWDEQYKSGQGRYFPAEELVRFLGRTYGPVTERKGHNLSAIDIGCGVGGNLLALAEWGFFCLGLECSSEAIKLARKNLDTKGVGYLVNFFHYIAPSTIKYPANSAELAIDVQTIQHLGVMDHEKMYQEVRRVLSPGGVFFSIHWVGSASDLPHIFPQHPELSLWQSSTTVRGLIEEAGLQVRYHEVIAKTYQLHMGRWVVLEAVKA